MVNSRKIYKRRRLKKYTKRGGGGVTDIIENMKRESGAKEREIQFQSDTRKEAMRAEIASARAMGKTVDMRETLNYGIYNFPKDKIKTLYVCSDLEGANIFNFTGDIHVGKKKDKEEYETKNIEIIEQQTLLDKKIFDKKRADVESEIMNNFDTDSEKGIISNLITADTALAYTGDLFDNRPHSIRLLKKMVEMKYRPATRDRLILIGGNRDYNKLRLGIELFLITNDDNSIFFDKKISLQKILQEGNLKFRTDNVEKFTYINWKTPKKAWAIDAYEKSIIDNISNGVFYSRVNSMLEETMGAKYLAYKTELITILHELEITLPEDETQDDFISKFFCILCMIMCFDYSNDTMVNTHPIYIDLKDKKYNELIYKYLGYIHPMALFTINGKKGLLSHSGFPDSGITSPLGYDPKIADNIINLEEILRELYIDKQNLLRDYNKWFMSDIVLKVENIPPNIIRYIQIAGGGPFKNIEFTPIIGNNAFKIIDKPNNMYYGGANEENRKKMEDKWLNEDKSNLKRFDFFKDFTEGRKILDYHIFGHMPQPFFPSVAQSKAKTTHIALDICKTDLGGQGNNYYSFTMLKLTGDLETDKLFGRSRLAQISKLIKKDPPVFEDNTELQDRVIYYYEPITTFKKKSNTITLSGVSRLHVEAQTVDPYKRMVYYEPEEAKPEEATPPSKGGSKKKCMHICGRLCRKCHKHDHQCRIKCHECQQEHCHTRRKKRSKTHKRVKRPRRHRKSRKR